LNLLDLLLLAIVAASVAAGFVAGFARGVIGFVAVIGGILFGLWFYGMPAEWLENHGVHAHAAASILGFLVVFFTFQLAGGITGKIIAKLFKWTGLSVVDRLLGAGFGLVRGVLAAVAFVAVMLAFTPSPIPNWMVNSTLLPYAMDASHLCASLAPRALTDAFRRSMDEVRKAWDDQSHKSLDRAKNRKQKSELKRIDQ
jgi:membrane protein required for colicin V production